MCIRDRRLILANDGAIDIYTNCQNGIDKATHITIDNTGLYSGCLLYTSKVSFLNDDSNKTVLDIQYVDKGSCAVDPTTRQDDPIAIPIKQSTIENDFTFKGWDTILSDKIFADRVINAVYTSTIRNYTVKYNSKGLTLQETVAPYGTYVKYEGDTPVYTAEEAAYKYNLFKGWDQSGYVKDVYKRQVDSCSKRGN